MDPKQPKLSPAEVVEILDHVLAGEASPEEIARLHDHQGSPKIEQALRNASHYAAVAGDEAQLERSTASWEMMLQRIEQEHATIPSRPAVRSHHARIFHRRDSRYLGSVLAGFAAAVTLLVLAVPRFRNAITRHHSTSQSRTYASAAGQRMTITLDDGSTVTLAPQTRIRYTSNDEGTRSVELVGEALFSVTGRNALPFVVRTGTITTRVLGTTFDVRRYPSETATQVAVISGRVMTSNTTHSVVVPAGSLARATDSIVTAVATGTPEQAILWTQGRLIFNHVAVKTMLTELSRWYGYDFRLADSVLADQYVSAEFHSDRPDETMTMVKAILGVTMTFEGKTVTLRSEIDSSTMHRGTNARRLFNNPVSEVGK